MSRVFFAGIIILVVATSACGSEAEIVEVTRAATEVKPTVAVRGTAVVKETAFETVTAAATATPFVPSFVVERHATDALRETPQRHSGKPCSRRSDPGQWLQASLPALHGSAQNAPWMQRPRQKIHPPYLPN